MYNIQTYRVGVYIYMDCLLYRHIYIHVWYISLSQWITKTMDDPFQLLRDWFIGPLFTWTFGIVERGRAQDVLFLKLQTALMVYFTWCLRLRKTGEWVKNPVLHLVQKIISIYMIRYMIYVIYTYKCHHHIYIYIYSYTYIYIYIYTPATHRYMTSVT